MNPKKLKEKLNYYVDKRSIDKIISTYLDLKNRIERKKSNQEFPIEHFSNLILHSYKRNPFFFMRDLYSPLRSALKEDFNRILFHKMEKYILKTFCFVKGEKRVFEVDGTFISKAEKTGSKIVFDNSDIYITNKRIIVQSSDMKIVPLEQSVNLHIGHDYMLDYYKTMIFRRNFNQDQDNPFLGYQFPLYDLNDLKTKDTKINYNFIEAGSKNFCEIIPTNQNMIEPMKTLLEKLSVNTPVSGHIRKPCKKCGELIKVNKKYCKHCQQILN